MKLEVHTFDPELLNVLMDRDAVQEGDMLELSDDAHLVYERTFIRKVKHFPLILHFTVDITSDRGAGDVVKWLFDCVGIKNLEKIQVEHQDAHMDAEQLLSLLRRR